MTQTSALCHLPRCLSYRLAALDGGSIPGTVRGSRLQPSAVSLQLTTETSAQRRDRVRRGSGADTKGRPEFKREMRQGLEATTSDSAAATASWTTSAPSSTSAPRHDTNRRSICADSQQQGSLPDTSSTSKSNPADEVHGQTAPPRIVYGAGKLARLPNELGRLGVSAPLIISSPSRIGLARKIQALIPNLDSRILDSAVVNVPARVVDDALERIAGRDVVISIGGASAVGLAKAVGCRKGIPHICIPTTYSGSEMMPLLMDGYAARHSNAGKAGQCRDRGSGGRGHTSPRTSSLRDPKVLPSVIIYDEDLTSSTPKRFSAPSDTSALLRANQFEECRMANDDATTQWSYLHLPGV